MDWQLVIMLVMGALLLVAGGWIKKLSTELKELVDAFAQAIEDGDMTSAELSQIIREARDVKDVIVGIYWTITSHLNK